MLCRRSQLAGLVAGIFGVALSASAQDRPSVRIRTVEVVATKVAEAPQDVPASIEVITGADLRARGASTLRDALSLAAGISIAPGGDGGPASAVPEFWGLREFDAFLLVVDGTPWGGAFNPAISSLSMRDVERVEVLRGPAPVTFGATSFVGVIHVVHKSSAEKARYFSLSGGTFGSFNASVDLATPFLAKWSSRLSADADRENFADDRTGYSRGHALWRASVVEGATRTWLTADLTLLRQSPASPHPRDGKTLSSAVPLDVNYNPAGARLDENRIFLSAGHERQILNGATWSTLASYTHSSQQILRGFLTNLANTPNNASGFRENIDINDLYADTHIAWPERSHLRFLTGVDMMLATGEGKGATFAYSTGPLKGSEQAPRVVVPKVLNLDSGSDRAFFGAYASTEWRPISRLTLSAGARANMTSESRGEGESVSHSKLSGTVGALFSLWDKDQGHVRLFANYRDTFKPAAFDFSLAENEGVLEPETSKSTEYGMKMRSLGGMVDVEASVFDMDFTNLVTATVVNNLPSLQNAGKTRFKGYELAADLRLGGDNSVRGTYSHHDGKFVDFVMNFGGVNTQLAGKRFEMSANELWSAGFAHAPDQGIVLTANMNYTGGRFMNKRNTAPLRGFSTIDAGLGYRVGDAEWRIDGRNLTNRRDVVSESEFGDAQYYRMHAMTVRAGVTIKF